MLSSDTRGTRTVDGIESGWADSLDFFFFDLGLTTSGGGGGSLLLVVVDDDEEEDDD